MSQYLNTVQLNGEKIKDKFRLRAPIDEETGEFPREYTEEDIEKVRKLQKSVAKNKSEVVIKGTGVLVGDDIYIDCPNGDMIYDIDSKAKIMQVYCANRAKGKNKIKKMCKDILDKEFSKLAKTKVESSYTFTDYSKLNKLYEKNENWFIFNIIEGDEELCFDFYLSDFSKVIKYIKPYKANALKSPFNKIYLPSYQDKLKKDKAIRDSFVKYSLPKDVWKLAKIQCQILAKEKHLKIGKAHEYAYSEFGKNKNRDFAIEAISQPEGKYKIPHYLHKIGLFEEFVNFLESQG